MRSHPAVSHSTNPASNLDGPRRSLARTLFEQVCRLRRSGHELRRQSGLYRTCEHIDSGCPRGIGPDAIAERRKPSSSSTRRSDSTTSPSFWRRPPTGRTSSPPSPTSGRRCLDRDCPAALPDVLRLVTTNTATPASACTFPPTPTSAPPTPSATNAPACSPPPSPPTPNGSSANHPNHQRCQPAPGSTHPTTARRPRSKSCSTVPHSG